MSLYQVQFDGEQYFVEAESFAAAIEAWKDDWRQEGEYDDEEPESVALLSDKHVIRAASPTPEAEGA